MIFRRSLLGFGFLVSLFAIALCADTFSIEADHVNYQDENKYVQATGNVVIVHRELQVSANSSSINIKEEKVYMGDGFTFNRSRQAMYGESLFYDFKSNEGRATSVNMTLLDKNIKGQTVTIQNDKIVINNAEQSACPHALKRCNLVTSKRLTIYPEWGDVVHDHAVVYFFFVPIMYVPNYVADASGRSDLMQTAIPRFGYNPVEGNFAKVGLSYYTNEKLNGSFDIHLLSRLGSRVGFTNNYKLDQANRGQVRIHYLTGLGGRLSYGLQHRTLLGVPVKDRKQIIDEFFSGIMPPSNQAYPEFVIDVTSREMSGYQWVSHKPKLGLYSPAYELFASSSLYYRFGGYIADTYEEDITDKIPNVEFEPGTRHYQHDSWDLDIYRPLRFAAWGDLTPGLFYKKAGYRESAQPIGDWRQWYYYANYQNTLDKLGLAVGYKNTMEESGSSPFNSESFYATTRQETNYKLTYQVWRELKLGYGEQYSITEHKVRDKVYEAEYLLCCWRLRLGWSQYLSQFTFNLGLE